MDDTLLSSGENGVEKFYGPPSIWSVLNAVYFLFRIRFELISCSRNPKSELRKNSETESELVYAHEPEHGTEFRVDSYSKSIEK